MYCSSAAALGQHFGRQRRRIAADIGTQPQRPAAACAPVSLQRATHVRQLGQQAASLQLLAFERVADAIDAQVLLGDSIAAIAGLQILAERANASHAASRCTRRIGWMSTCTGIITCACASVMLSVSTRNGMSSVTSWITE